MPRGFPGPGCPVLFPLELAIVFGLFCSGAVKYVAVPLVFGRDRLPSVVVWSWSMGWARLVVQGAIGVLSRIFKNLNRISIFKIVLTIIFRKVCEYSKETRAKKRNYIAMAYCRSWF